MTPSGAERRSSRKAREELQRIIDLCRSVELKDLDPYLVDVDDLIKAIKICFPMLRSAEDLCLDAEALNQIASIVKMQSEWVKRRATTLYRDPFLIEEKIRKLPIDEIAMIFLESWRPLVDLEQLTARSFHESLKYWSSLPPLSERWHRVSCTKVEAQLTTKEEVVKEGLLSNESFMAEVEKMWMELKELTAKWGKARYWDFICAETYEETARRAYLTSFLVTCGYARLEVNFLEDEIFISPCEEITPPKNSDSISFPIAISFEEWKRWRENQRV